MRKTKILIALAALVTGVSIWALQVSAQATTSAAPPATAPAPVARGGRAGRGAFQDPNAALTNLALVAIPSTSYVSPHETLGAINDGLFPNPQAHYGNWPNSGTQWVQYTWPKAISTGKVDVYWWQDGAGIRLPVVCRLKYWNGSQFVDVPNVKGLGVAGNQFNETTFDEISTDKIRLEMDSAPGAQISTGIIEFRVFDSGKSPPMPPQVAAGIDRVVVLKGKTYLTGTVKQVGAAGGANLAWTKESGPGTVQFADARSAATTATFNELGDYVLKLTSSAGELSSSSTLKVRVDPASSGERLDPVQTSTYKIDSPLWSPRLKVQITTWIPHCVDYLEHPEKARQGPGGLDNFIEAGKKLRGEPAARHLGYPFSNAYTYNTLEAMCEAMMFDPQRDQDIIKAQADLRAVIDRWIPIILAAQEPDGYIQTRFTLNGGNHWSPATRGEHEGYVMGYFLESAIAHYNMTQGRDRRLYDAARKCADCWVDNIGPAGQLNSKGQPKKVWYDGHQEMENALVRFSRLVDVADGPGKGKPYVELAKFLLDSRTGGTTYDQSHLPVVKQYEAVGHSVRAAYTYTGMASVAAEFHDLDYESATKSLWDNIMNKKIYLTGGIGSTGSNEGFAANYDLNNASYCESCANCGNLFFQYNMLLNYHDAKYVNAYEDTLYNAILGDNNLAGTMFEYTNPLVVSGPRETWDGCPCCVGNIPRTLLQLPTWSYSTGANDLYVNLFIGGTMTVHKFQGTDVQMVQKTNYPWDGKVDITVNPTVAKNFTLRIRVPDHQISTLYMNAPVVAPTLKALSVNGAPMNFKVEGGYALITRDWKAGDKIDFEIPLEAQRVKADNNVTATRGRVALRYGPLIYNVETVDGNNMNAVLPADAPLATEWKPDLLEGVMVIKSQYTGGQDLLAIPNYARNNRQPAAGGGRGGGVFSQVWIRDQ